MTEMWGVIGMKIIIESEYPSHNRIIIDTDITFAKKIMDLIWKEITIESLNRTISFKEKEDE